MRMRLIVVAIMLLSFLRSDAQPFTIKGTVTDTVNVSNLPHASVTLLHAADSILETFTRTDENGGFSLSPASKGKYVLLITFPGFADYVDVVDVKGNETDLGMIPLVSRTHLLKEFVLTQQYAAIKVKGDTTEYVADSFKTRDNATVEALLKKLPGIQVDKNGQITAQGEKVQKILVDGEEFFSDDPAVVTKSLQAKAIDKVQVFDKKSEQAEFTGIDDGERSKTINLQLKDEMKKGLFGKVVAGAGPADEQNYFENQAMINAFKGKRKLSAFGIASNTGRIGLGWEDRNKFGGSSGNTEVTEDGGVISYYNSDEGDFESWRGTYNGEGLPKAWTGGVHFSNKWLQDRHHFSSNYRYAKQNIETLGNTLTQYALPGDSAYYTKESRDVFSSGQRHKVDGNYEWKLDSTSTLKLTAAAGYSNTESRTINKTESLSALSDGNANLLNTNNRELTSDAVSSTLNATLDYRKKFKKAGRTISVNITERYKDAESEGLLKAVNSIGSGNIDQRKKNNSEVLSLSSRMSYTEPLSKKIFLELNYNATVNNNNAERNTWDKANPSENSYDTLNALLSSNYTYNVFVNSGGSNLRLVYDKVKFSFGGAVSNARFSQKDLLRDTAIVRNYVNFFPRANFTYNLSKQSKFSLNYNGNTEQPTFDQIQPLVNNTDPLNISIGNPNLVQAFNHSFYAQFNNYKMLTGRYIWMNGGISFTDNDISRSENIDAIGRRVYQYLNVDGNYNAWGYVGYGFKIKKLNTQVGSHASTNIQHVNNIVNGVKNISDFNVYTGGLDFNYDAGDEKLSIRFAPGISYNDNKSTISTASTSFWTTNNEFEISYEFPFKLEVGTEVAWYMREKTAVFDRNNNVIKWDAYISKKFLKNDQLELKASVFDILNQNLGFTRYAQNNYIVENNYNTIRRYGMLSLTWNFTRTAGGAPQQEAQGIIINTN